MNKRSARVVYVWRNAEGPCEIRLELMRSDDECFVKHTYPLEMRGLVERYARDWVEVGIREEGEFNFNAATKQENQHAN